MSTKSKPQDVSKVHGKDVATFEQLPKNTKEGMKLKEHDEKTTGSDQVVTTRKIKEKARK